MRPRHAEERRAGGTVAHIVDVGCRVWKQSSRRRWHGADGAPASSRGATRRACGRRRRASARGRLARWVRARARRVRPRRPRRRRRAQSRRKAQSESVRRSIPRHCACDLVVGLETERQLLVVLDLPQSAQRARAGRRSPSRLVFAARRRVAGGDREGHRTSRARGSTIRVQQRVVHRMLKQPASRRRALAWCRGFSRHRRVDQERRVRRGRPPRHQWLSDAHTRRCAGLLHLAAARGEHRAARREHVRRVGAIDSGRVIKRLGLESDDVWRGRHRPGRPRRRRSGALRIERHRKSFELQRRRRRAASSRMWGVSDGDGALYVPTDEHGARAAQPGGGADDAHQRAGVGRGEPRSTSCSGSAARSTPTSGARSASR